MGEDAVVGYGARGREEEAREEPLIPLPAESGCWAHWDNQPLRVRLSPFGLGANRLAQDLLAPHGLGKQ